MALRFSRLTRKNIRQLQPGEKFTEHGITVARLGDGDLRYSVGIMEGRQRIHRVIGKESEGVRRGQCVKFIETTRTEAREGRLSLPSKRKTPLTFRQAAKAYLKLLEDTGGKNIQRKRWQLDKHLTPFFGSQRLDSITEFTVGRYKKRRRDAGAAKATINRELAVLSHLFGRAVKQKWIKARPCDIEREEEGRRHIEVLTDEQADALLEAAVKDQNSYCWLFVAFGLNTAMRHNEILQARFDHLDLEHRRLFIPQAKVGMREQPITLELAKILRKEREGRDDRDGWIFPASRLSSSRKGHRSPMGREFRRAVIAAKLDPARVTPHTMRHTAITNLVKAGVDLPTIQKISGHKTLYMVEPIYPRPRPAH